MNNTQLNNFKKFIKNSIKTNCPKFVKFDSLDPNTLEFYVTIPLEKRMSDSKKFMELDSQLEKWAKTFGYIEYGSGTGGDTYDIHFGPNDKLLNDRLRRIKKALKNAIDRVEYANDLEEVVKLMQNIKLLDKDEDFGLTLNF